MRFFLGSGERNSIRNAAYEYAPRRPLVYASAYKRSEFFGYSVRFKARTDSRNQFVAVQADVIVQNSFDESDDVVR